MIYAYSTLLNERDELLEKRKVLLETMNSSNKDEILDQLEIADDYINQIENAIKYLEPEVFVWTK